MNQVIKPKKGYKLVEWSFGKEIEIPEEWKVTKFNSKIRMEYGSSLTKEQRDNLGKPVYGSGGIIGFHSKPIVSGPAVLVARKGSLGNTFYEMRDFFPIDTVYYITKNETESYILFLFYYIQNMKLENYAIVTSKPGISRNEIYSLLIIIPPYTEQQKIASILCNVDALIESTQDVVDKSEQLKKGLMQKLLTRGIEHAKFKKVKGFFKKEVWIPEEWELRLLQNFMKITMGMSPPSKSYNEDEIGLPFYQGVTDFGDIYPTTTVWCSEPKKIAEKNQILFSVRAPVGEINITKEKSCLGRGVCSLDVLDNILMYCYFLISFNKKQFLVYAQGTTYDAINKNEIVKVKLPFTSNSKEQQKIASILSGVDAYIQKTRQKVKALKNKSIKILLANKILACL